MKTALLLLAVLPALGQAAPPGDARARVERRVHLMRLVVLTEELGLPEDKALRLNKLMGQVDERRRKIGEQAREVRAVLRRASDGDEQAAKDVDASVDKLLEARKAMGELDREMYKAVAKELNPVQRAKFVLAMMQYRHQLERMAEKARERLGEGPGAGPGMGPKPGPGWRRMQRAEEGDDF